MSHISDLINRLTSIIDKWEEYYAIEKSFGDPGDRLLSLIPKNVKKPGKQVVILIDEDDRPTLDNIANINLMQEMRDLVFLFRIMKTIG